jgi:ClpP class serine protease
MTQLGTLTTHTPNLPPALLAVLGIGLVSHWMPERWYEGARSGFERLLLKKHEIDYELHTAGEHKRTLTVFGENTEAGREKFRETLEDAHALFKAFIQQNRPQVDIAEVATGEHWFGTRALALKLVDELKTSDDYLLERAKTCDLYELRYRRHKGFVERMAGGLARGRATLPF